MPSASINSDYLWLIPLLPFAGFLINGTVGRKLPRALVTAVALICTAIPAVIVAWLWIDDEVRWRARRPSTSSAGPGSPITGLHVDFAFTVDHLTLIMLGVVTGVGFLIHLYSAGYMAHEEGYWRFFAYLNLFMFFMLVLVLAEQLPAALRRLGGRRSRLLPADRLLLQEGLRRQRRQESLHRQPHRRLRLPARDVPAHRALRLARLQRTSSTRSASHPEWHGGFLTAIALLLVLGAAGKVRADSALRLAARRDGRPHAGLRADPRRHHGHRRHLHGRALPRALRPLAPTLSASSPSSAPRPRSSPPPSAWCSTTSSASSPTPPSRSSATCSWPAESAPTPPASST